jgi:hypothetical protein
VAPPASHTSVTTALTIASSSNNLLYLGSASPVPGRWEWPDVEPQLPCAATWRWPRGAVFPAQRRQRVGVVVHLGFSLIDGLGQAFLFSVPGFKNVTIGASNINSLAANYTACQAPISFTNGLRAPTQPSSSNGPVRFSYSYSISDGATYRMVGNLTFTTVSAFANSHDLLANPYQIVTKDTGTRTYTYLPTSTQLTSTVHGLNQLASVLAKQRFYPYTLLSAPGVYTINSVPFFDADGLEFAVTPSIPVNGNAPGVGSQYTATTLSVTTAPSMVAVLTDGVYTNAPLLASQVQSYTLM